MDKAILHLIELSERYKKRVEKARRVVKSMVGTVAFFFMMIRQYMDNMGVGEEQIIMNDYLIPGYYLQKVAQKEKTVNCELSTIVFNCPQSFKAKRNYCKSF
jgi:hypothetical protein